MFFLFILNPFDWLGIDPERVVAIFKMCGLCVEKDDVDSALNLIIPIVLIIGAMGMIAWRYVRRKLDVKKWRKNTIEEKLGREFAGFLKKNGNRCYVRTTFQTIPPDDTQDPAENINIGPRNDLLDFYLRNVLVKDNRNNFLYCVLAGSGMGKTTFSVNLLMEYINSYTDTTLPYNIHLLSLASENVLTDINKIQEQGKSILILDALDENTEAVKDYAKFIGKLEEAVKFFRIVIVTCRTQFFSNSDNEPQKSKLTYYGKEKSFQVYTKHYIAFFDNKDIDEFLKKKYHTKKERKRALQIVKKTNSLMMRPLLLSYVDDLMGTNMNKLTYYGIYKALIDKWIDREVNNWNQKNQIDGLKDKLYDFSKFLAVDIYKNKEKRNGLYITREEFESFLTEFSFEDPYSWSGRSLVNRDSAGYIKFSHKSFLEFFLANEMFYNGMKVSFEGMDVARKFYEELCMEEFMDVLSHNYINFKLNSVTKILMIYQTAGYSLEHISVPFRFNVIVLPWQVVDEMVLSWLCKYHGLERLVIYNYTGDVIPVKLLNIYGLKFIVILGETVPDNAFVKKAKAKKVMVDYQVTDVNQIISKDNIDSLINKMDMSVLFQTKLSESENLMEILKKLSKS